MREKLLSVKGVVIIAIVMTVALTVFLFAVDRSRQGKAEVDVVVVPKHAEVKLDGENIKAGKNYISYGDHTFNASSEGFASIEKKTSVSNKESITLILTPVSDEAKEYAKRNAHLYTEAEGIAGKQAQKEGEALKTRYPLLNSLPFQSLLFDINYRMDDDKLIIEIQADSPLNRSYALKQIENFGYDVHDYNIEFVNIAKNPFEEQKQ